MVGDPLPSAAYNGSVALFFNLISKTDFQNISKNLTHIHRIGKNFAYFIFFLNTSDCPNTSKFLYTLFT